MSDVIICAIDGSEATGPVLETGRWLAEVLDARLLAVHATDSWTGTGESEASLRSALGDTDGGLRIVGGPPARAITEMADQEDAELIVIGSRGRGGLRSALLGSVSREVAAQAGRPVVVVPPDGRSTEDGPARSGGSLVLGVDGSEDARAAAALAGQLAQRLGLRLVIVHARQNLRAVAAYPRAHSSTPPITGQEDSVQRLVDQVVDQARQTAAMEATTVVEPGPPAEVLEQVAEREDARLIVVAARGAGGVRTALLGSVAAELGATAGRPVLMLSRAGVRADA